jgi:hypothetical protein
MLSVARYCPANYYSPYRGATTATGGEKGAKSA